MGELLTHAPLPLWRHFYKAGLRRTLPTDELLSPWIKKGGEFLWVYRSAISLAVVALLRKSTLKKTAVTVWVPDYFCNSSLVYLRSLGVKLIFYPITEKLCPNWGQLKRLLRESSPDIFIMVHYFGRPVSCGGAVKQFCKKTGAWLIEDAAHVFRAVSGVGDVGDFVFFSPHKHLPLPDGAVLLLRKNGPSELHLEPEVINTFSWLNQHFSNERCVFNTLAAWCAKRGAQMLGVPHRVKALPSFRTDPDDAGSVQRIVNFGMSVLAKKMLGALILDMDDFEKIRRKNQNMWQKVLMTLSARQMFNVSPLNYEEAGYLMGVSCPTESDARQTYDYFIEMGVPVTTWPDLPPEIFENPLCHEIALKLRRTRVYFPIHQSIRPKEIKIMLRTAIQDSSF